MIISLNGILTEKRANHVVVETGGLGYEVGVSVSCSAELPSVGSAVRLHIHHQFTESDQRLFGFLHTQEKRLFELLITVKGIGPKLALTVLSGLDEAGISRAIATQDLPTLSRIPGIGRKTAERIVVELRDKIGPGADGGALPGSDPDARSEAVAALEALGYKRVDADKAIAGALQEGGDMSNAGDLVKRGLRLVTLR
jgi:Holliday junction DNA helicase RuvA